MEAAETVVEEVEETVETVVLDSVTGRSWMKRSR